MKYVHFLSNTFRPRGCTESFTMTYMVLSDHKQLKPGHHMMTPASYETAKTYADKVGAEFVGPAVEPVVEAAKNRKETRKEKVLFGGRSGGKSQGNVPLKALDDARKIQGKGKYNSFTNYCYGDGYFARSCIDKYGEKVWEMANKIVSEEK